MCEQLGKNYYCYLIFRNRSALYSSVNLFFPFFDKLGLDIELMNLLMVNITNHLMVNITNQLKKTSISDFPEFVVVLCLDNFFLGGNLYC